MSRIETTERAIRRFIERLGGPEGLAVCYEAGPGGFALPGVLVGDIVGRGWLCALSSPSGYWQCAIYGSVCRAALMLEAYFPGDD